MGLPAISTQEGVDLQTALAWPLAQFGIKVTERAMIFGKSAIDPESFEALINALRLAKEHHMAELTMIKCWLGDALSWGESRWGEDVYQRVMEVAGEIYERQTLYNVTWVANNVPEENRLPGLSFEQYAKVAPLDPPDQLEILKAAVEENLTVAETGRLVRDRTATNNHKDPDVEEARRRLHAAREALEPLELAAAAGLVYQYFRQWIAE